MVYARIAIIAVAIATLFGLGWTVRGWHEDAKALHAKQKADEAAAAQAVKDKEIASGYERERARATGALLSALERARADRVRVLPSAPQAGAASQPDAACAGGLSGADREALEGRLSALRDESLTIAGRADACAIALSALQAWVNGQ